MVTDTYDFIWEKIIYPCINDVKSKYACYDSSLSIKSDLKDRIFKIYNRSRDNVKLSYYAPEERMDAIKIDKHKIAACFTDAFIRAKACTFNTRNEEIVKNIGLINYEIAFNVGMGILYVSLLTYYNSTQNEECYSKLSEWGNLQFPDTTPGHDDYKLGRIKTLALNDLGGVDFDILTYADMLFWIEYYNRQLLENKIDVGYVNIDTSTVD